MGIKKILSISLPITILLVLALLYFTMSMNHADPLYEPIATVGGVLIVAAIVQGIFWKFAKHT